MVWHVARVWTSIYESLLVRVEFSLRVSRGLYGLLRCQALQQGEDYVERVGLTFARADVAPMRATSLTTSSSFLFAYVFVSSTLHACAHHVAHIWTSSGDRSGYMTNLSLESVARIIWALLTQLVTSTDLLLWYLACPVSLPPSVGLEVPHAAESLLGRSRLEPESA